MFGIRHIMISTSPEDKFQPFSKAAKQELIQEKYLNWSRHQMCIVFGISRRKVPCNIFHAASLRSSSIFPSKRISKLNILADKTYFPHLLYICSSSWSHNILSCSSCRPLWSIPSTSTIVATTTSIVARCYSNASKCTVSSLYCSSFSNNRWISLRIYIYTRYIVSQMMYSITNQ